MIALVLALALAAPQEPVVRTDDGPVRGEAAGEGAVFRGIRFAAPPVGPLRWRAPSRPRRWTAPADATQVHPSCPQTVSGDWNRAAAENASEDCLFLDIRTPRLDAAAKLPVMVWIHGGSNRAGSGNGTVESRITDNGLVLVSVQYRLGALGFLSHPALSRQGGPKGNWGLLDQQAALDWVRRNIARFGGDPARVTIAGESAGAQDVGLHLLSPGSRALFAQAIAESGTAGFGTPPRTLATNVRLGERIAREAGLPARATAAQLRALPVAALLAADQAVDVPGLDDNGFIWLQATVDGQVLPDTPARLIAAGKIARVPLLIGVNAREFAIKNGATPARVAREFGANAASALAFYGLQPGGTPVDDPRLGDAAMQFATDIVFRCPTVAVSKAAARGGAPVWQYQFDYAPPGGTVSHATELPFVFGEPEGAPPLGRYWANFVATGDPNGGELPRWPRYDVTTRAYLSIEQTGPVAKRDLRGQVCALRATP